MSSRTLVCALAIALLATSASAAPKRTRRAAPPEPANAVSFNFEYEDFGNAFDPWSLASVEYKHRLDFGPVIGRLNQARRFGKSGTQLEVDAYPRLGRGMYLYTNLGVSPSSIFPKQRAGIELYKSLPHAYEASGGVRYLHFSGANVTLFTASVARYLGNYYFSARPYISHRPGGTATSGELLVRNYFATADDYAQLSATIGSAPTFDIAPDAVERQQSWNVRALAKHALVRNLIVTAQVGYRSEQIRQSVYRRGWMLGAGVEHRF